MDLNHYTPPTRGYVGTAAAREHSGGAYGLKQVHLPPDWQEQDRHSERRMWAVIGVALVGVIVAYLLVQANRSPLYAVSNPVEVQSDH